MSVELDNKTGREDGPAVDREPAILKYVTTGQEKQTDILTGLTYRYWHETRQKTLSGSVISFLCSDFWARLKLYTLYLKPTNKKKKEDQQYIEGILKLLHQVIVFSTKTLLWIYLTDPVYALGSFFIAVRNKSSENYSHAVDQSQVSS